MSEQRCYKLQFIVHLPGKRKRRGNSGSIAFCWMPSGLGILHVDLCTKLLLVQAAGGGSKTARTARNVTAASYIRTPFLQAISLQTVPKE